MLTALFSYLLPVMCRADSDGLITTSPKSDPTVTNDHLLREFLGPVVRFRCLMDETNAAPNSRYVEETPWLMCLFEVFHSLMVELPQIRVLVPFCCQHGSSVTRDEFCFVFMPVSDSTYTFPPPPVLAQYNDQFHITPDKNSSLMLICWCYRPGNTTIRACSSSPWL